MNAAKWKFKIVFCLIFFVSRRANGLIKKNCCGIFQLKRSDFNLCPIKCQALFFASLRRGSSSGRRFDGSFLSSAPESSEGDDFHSRSVSPHNRAIKTEIIDFFMSVGYGEIKSRLWGRAKQHFCAIFHKCCQHNKMCFAWLNSNCVPSFVRAMRSRMSKRDKR